MKRVLLEILAESESRQFFNLKDRNTEINPYLPKVQTVVGSRRSGKSSLLKLAIQKLQADGIAKNQICYVPLEDERLLGEIYEPDLILQAFREYYPENAALKDVFFFFDEIQHLPKWEHFINRLHEHVSQNIIITGSNSKTIHSEVASVMRGRGLPSELLPLSFSEYLRFKNITFSEYGSQKAIVINAFAQYMKWGGFPEIVNNENINPRDILQEYFNTVLYRDVLDQKGGNSNYIRYLFHRIANNTGKTISLRKIFQELKSRGFAVSQGTIYQLADLAESVYLFKRISRFDASLIKRENADKKSYYIDNGLLHAIDSSFSSNLGMLLENLVFWQLYRLYGNIYTTDIYYYKDQYHECDFIIYKEGGKALPVQVSLYLTNESTKLREVKGLVKACQQTNSSKGFIITYDEEMTFNQNGIEIQCISAWKWCAKETDLFSLL